MRKIILVLMLVLGISLPSTSRAQVQNQLISDLVNVGISVGAAMTGSIPVALASGFLAKYLSVYGVAGIRALIDAVNGQTPKDVSEVNLLYVYLLHIKQNLYRSLIDIREAVATSKEKSLLADELDRMLSTLSEKCGQDQKCPVLGVDPTLVEFEFLSVVLDGKRTVDINNVLSVDEIKNSYQYLILLYLDVVLTEQKIIETQYQVLADRLLESIKELDGNPYLSQAEKEYRTQLALGLALSWQQKADDRRVMIATSLRQQMEAIRGENRDLQQQIDEYRRRAKP